MKRKAGVSVILITPSRKTILVLRSDGQGYEPVTGGIDEGESPVLAATRELHEEIGISLNPDKLVLHTIFGLSCGASVYTYVAEVPELCNMDVKLQKSEVLETESFSAEKILKMRKEQRHNLKETILGFNAFKRIIFVLQNYPQMSKRVFYENLNTAFFDSTGFRQTRYD